MAVYPKPLHFDRVRVLDVEGGVYRPGEPRRWSPAAAVASRGAWRQPPSGAAGEAAAGTLAEAKADLPEAPPEAREADAGPPVAPGPVAHDGAALGPAEPAPEDVPRQRPSSVAEHDDRGPRRIALIGVVTRAVDEARKLHAVIDLVCDTCSGEERRATGPWEFSLSLQPQGLDDASLTIRLSRQSLALRFSCTSRATHDLLSRHAATLQAQLEERLTPSQAVDIAVCDASRSP